MNTLAAFEVLGVPAPQGSKTRMPNGAMLDGKSAGARAKHKAWRTAVADMARELAEDEAHDGQLCLSIVFRFPMPASRPKRVQALGRWPHTVKPDIDKVVRSTLDGLAVKSGGGLIRDDARVFKIDVEAWEVTGWTGAEIVLRRWEG